MRKVCYTVLPLIGALFVLVNAAHAQSKEKSTSRLARCPDDAPTTGGYRNYSYGFSIMIPAGLKGYWNSIPCAKDKNDCVCMGDHGRHIPIRRETYLEVVADHWIEETRKQTIDYELACTLSTHRKSGEVIEKLSQTRARLRRFPATRVKLRYKDAKTGVMMIEERIVCAPMDKEHRGEVYTIYLVTPESSYTKDRLLLERVLHSWEFRHIP